MTQLKWYQISAVSLILMLGLFDGAQAKAITAKSLTPTESAKVDKHAVLDAKKAAKKAERESKRAEKKAKGKGKSSVVGAENLDKKILDSGDSKAKAANDKGSSDKALSDKASGDKSASDKQASEKRTATEGSSGESNTGSLSGEAKGSAVTNDVVPSDNRASNKQETSAVVIPLEPIEVAGDEPDPALICVLRDLAKALKDSPEAANVTIPQQKEALKVAQQALSRVVDNPRLLSNRIISGSQKTSMETTMTAESWQSGDLALSKRSHVSFSVLWAKKIDGVITINVTGTYPQSNNQLSEFVLVASGRSGVESGFDIQSQSQVTFWLGKLSNLFIESGLSQANSDPALKNKRVTVSGVITRKERLKAQLLDATSVEKEKAAFGLPLSSIAKAEGQGAVKRDAAKQGAAKQGAAKQDASKPDATQQDTINQDATNQDAIHQDSGLRQAMDSLSGAPAIATTVQTSPIVSANGANITKRVPSSEAYLLFPDRAIAGEPLTLSILTPNDFPEPFVDLSFNGEVGTSNKDGRVTFWVQEEAIPGPSLRVNVPCREQISGAVINVLQPLTKAASDASPKIDAVYSVVNPSRIVTINGHHFDGRAEANRVSIDGVMDAKLLVSSPVQIKALVPYNLVPGQHALTVTSSGRVSNISSFEMVAVEVHSGAKNKKKADGNRIVLRARGTQKPLRLKVKNYSPDIIKFADGNEMRVITSGGQDNAVILGVKRLKKGNFRVVASIE